MVVDPETDPGCAGTAETDTEIFCAALLPQPLLAVTDTVPPVLLAVAVIELVADVPDQPEGSVHV